MGSSHNLHNRRGQPAIPFMYNLFPQGEQMVNNLSPNQTKILGAALIELLNGQLSDETIAAVDSIKREDVPEPLNNLVGWMHGMTTQPELRESCITSLIDEIRIASIEALEKRKE